jgi:branched-chain amino acid aminotransferase
MEEIRRAGADGTLREVFGTGTAAVVSPVGSLRYRGEELVVIGGAPGEISRRFFDEITGIQYGEIEDRYGWVRRVE